jgi:glycosyltransferase involved in cell wall biosynthesis
MSASRNTSDPLRVVVLMAMTSPWSRLIVERLAALGVEVHVVDLQPKGQESAYLQIAPPALRESDSKLESRVASIQRVFPPTSMIARLMYSARALRRITRERRADAVLTLYGGSLAATAYLSGIRPYVVYVVGSDVLLANWLQKRVTRVTLTGAQDVVANGEYLAAKTRELVPSANVTSLYIGVDIDHLPFSERRDASPRFVCTRGFLPVYDNATIIRAFGNLRSIPTDLTVSFVSSGPLLPESVALANQVIAPNWRDRMVFGGGVSDTDLKSALESSCYYLSASLSDGASSSLLEAMACGLFPILSDIPANCEWVTHEANGLLFPPGNDSYLGECIHRAIVGEPWMLNARVANRRLVEDRANVNVSMKALVGILDPRRKNRSQA